MVEPSQSPWVRGPMIGTLPSCHSPWKNVHVREWLTDFVLETMANLHIGTMELWSVDHELGIRQIGKPGAMRTLEVFATFPVEPDQALHAAVGLQSDGDSATPEQEAADRTGAHDVVSHMRAIDQLHGERCDPADSHRLQDERKGAVIRSAAYQAEAAIGCVTCKQRGVSFGQAGDRLRVLPDGFDTHSLGGTRHRWKRKEHAAAIAAESLSFDGLPSPLRRTDIDVGDVLVTLRDLGQHRSVAAKGRFHIPAGEIAAD